MIICTGGAYTYREGAKWKRSSKQAARGVERENKGRWSGKSSADMRSGLFYPPLIPVLMNRIITHTLYCVCPLCTPHTHTQQQLSDENQFGFSSLLGDTLSSGRERQPYCVISLSTSAQISQMIKRERAEAAFLHCSPGYCCLQWSREM